MCLSLLTYEKAARAYRVPDSWGNSKIEMVTTYVTPCHSWTLPSKKEAALPHPQDVHSSGEEIDLEPDGSSLCGQDVSQVKQAGSNQETAHPGLSERISSRELVMWVVRAWSEHQ